MACSILPVSAFQSTNLNNKIDSFNRLADRIVRSMGAPIVTIEVHQDQLFENIAIACEFFTKYAGYTKEYLVFDSALYTQDQGIRIDHLFTVKASDSLANRLAHKTPSRSTASYISAMPVVYVCVSAVEASVFSSLSALSSTLADGIQFNEILDNSTYNQLGTALLTSPSVSGYNFAGHFLPSISERSLTIQGSNAQQVEIYNNMFDYDTMDYRKVIAITDFEEGESTGINTLFTIEQTLAQQTYFSYAMGNYGFDLVSWYTLKQWLDTREKVLAIKRAFEFDERTQVLRMYPQPTNNVRFYGCLPCWVERPLRDIVKEQWVYQYALALTKISVGYVRGKYGSLPLFGGQVFSSDIVTQGLNEKDKLEQMMLTGASPGMGDADPVMFFVG
jgi:hypothetical protein